MLGTVELLVVVEDVDFDGEVGDGFEGDWGASSALHDLDDLVVGEEDESGAVGERDKVGIVDGEVESDFLGDDGVLDGGGGVFLGSEGEWRMVVLLDGVEKWLEFK